MFWNNTPDNNIHELCWDQEYWEWSSLKIPEWLRVKIYHTMFETPASEEIRETQKNLHTLWSNVLENFLWVECKIESNSEILSDIFYREIVRSIVFGLKESHFTLDSLDFWDPEFLNTILISSFQSLLQQNPDEFERLKNLGAVEQKMKVWKIVINYSNVFWYFETSWWEDLQNNILEVTQDSLVLREWTLSEFIENEWIPVSTQRVLYKLLREKGNFHNLHQDDWEKVLSNFKNLVHFIVAVESFWGQYIENNEWSSGKWPFQYLDGFKNGEVTLVSGQPAFSRENQNFSPFDTALRRSMRYYSWGASDYYNYGKYSDQIPAWIIEAYENQPNISPLDLSHEESLNLWVIDIFSRESSYEYLAEILIYGNAESMKELYNRIHHTQPNEQVNTNVARNFEIFSQRFIALPEDIYTFTGESTEI